MKLKKFLDKNIPYKSNSNLEELQSLAIINGINLDKKKPRSKKVICSNFFLKKKVFFRIFF